MKQIIDISDELFSIFKKHGIMAFDYFNEYDKDQIAIAIVHGTPYNKTVKINTNDIEYKAYCKGLEDGKKIARPQGEWINREAVSNTIFPFWERYECNQCHKFSGYSNFCPNCGADMRGKEE